MSDNALTAEQVEKLNAISSSEELSAFVESEGVELTEEMLSTVAGGHPNDIDINVERRKFGIPRTCPYCGTRDYYLMGGRFNECYTCGQYF